MSQSPPGDPERTHAPPDGLLSEPPASQVTSRSDNDSATADPDWSVDGAVGLSLRPEARAMGRYTLLSELGSGGMGVVYKAWDPALDRAVALKVLLAGRLASNRHLSRFLDEARAIARLDHPALVEVYDIGLVDGCPYFTMEFVAGSDLEQVAARAPLDPVRACRLLARVARGLAQAHAQGIVHRDIKPANILVDADDTPRLIDFGVARFVESTDERTRTGQVVGTPAYMAPEQARGDLAAIGPATDVFGLGATLYRLVTGQAPRGPEPTSTATADAPRDVLAICYTAMARDPAERYGSMVELADELERFTRGEPVHAALPGPWRRLRWRLREARGALLGATVAAALAGAVWLGVDAWQGHRAAQADARREAEATLRLDEALFESDRLRAADAHGQAARTEEAVALRPEVQETRALARFHLQRAAAARARRDTTGAREAAASAFAVALHPDETADALVELGRVFAAEHRVEALRAIVERLERRFPETPSLDPLRLASAMAELRFADAAALARRIGDPRASVLAALATAHPTVWTRETLALPRMYQQSQGDVDGDGHPELFVGSTPLRVDDPALPRADLPPIDPQTNVTVLGGGLAAFQDAGGRRLMTVDGGRWRPLTSLDGYSSYALTDLDGSGAPRLFAVGGWRLRAFSPTPAGDWTASPLHPPTEAAQIVPRAVHAARFAHHGPALIVTSGGWKTYDIRIYTAGEGGALRLAARRKVGEITSSTLVERPGADPLIAVVVRRMLPEPRLFPPEHPSGAPEGIHVFEWAADGLREVRHVPLDADRESEFRLTAGDLDGDGLPELILSHQNARRPARIFGAMGRDPAIPLIGVDILAAAQLDDDPALEAVILDDHGDRIWALGVGDDALPARAGQPLPGRSRPGQPPLGAEVEDGPPAIHELARLGLIDEAIDAWRRRIRLGRAPARAAWHAARLAEGRDRPLDAARLYLDAAGGDRPAEALRSAARAAERALDWSSAAEALRRLVGRPDGSADDRAHLALLDRRLDRRVTLVPGDGLDPRMRITVPDRLRVEPGGPLEVIGDCVGPIARLPLVATGGPLGAEVVMSTPRLEYAGSVALGLGVRAPDGSERHLYQLENVAWGGGSVVMQRAMVTRKGMHQDVIFNRHAIEPVGSPLHVRVWLDPQSGALEVAEDTTGHRTSTRVPLDRLPRPGEALFLELSSGARDLPECGAVRVVIERLSLDGLAVDDRPPPADEAPLHAAGRALAEGRPQAVSALLDGRNDEAADALRMAAAYDRGRAAEGDAQVRRRVAGMTPSGVFDQVLRGRLRRDPLHFAPLIRATLGPAADGLLGAAFAVQLDKHALDPEVQLAVRAALIGAERTTDDPDARMALLLARSAAHRRAGRIGAARADLEQYRVLLEGRAPPGDDAAAVARGQAWSRYHRLRAESDAQAGDLDAAERAVRAGLAIDPTPELLADRLLASPALRPLRDRPIWATVQGAAAWSD